MIELNNVYNEDCLEGMKKIPDKSVDMILCDLPYGITACSWDTIIPFDKLWEQYERIITDKGAIVLTASQPFTSALVMSNPKLFKYEWIWEKQKASNFMSAKYAPLKYHESVLIFSKGTPNYYPQKYEVLEIEELMGMNKKQLTETITNRDIDRFGKVDRRKTVNNPVTHKDTLGMKITKTRKKDTGERFPKSVVKINKPLRNIHPTQKPVELCEYFINSYSKEGDTILDNCMGSGTTAIACLNTNRNYIGFELDEDYCNMSKKRIIEHVNKQST